MKAKIKQILAYILRGWDKEQEPTHPALRILPPFFYELLAFFIGVAIFLQVVTYLKNLFN